MFGWLHFNKMRLGIFLQILFIVPSSFAVDSASIRNAIEEDQVKSIRNWVEAGKLSKDDFVEAPPYGSAGMPLLTLAARTGSEKVVSYLISIKADLNIKTPVNETALVLAAYYG